MIFSGEKVSVRMAVRIEVGPYNDRNDGYTRTFHSRSKVRNACIHKVGKVVRVKPSHKDGNFVYQWVDEEVA